MALVKSQIPPAAAARMGKIETQVESFGYVGVLKARKHANHRRFVAWLIDELPVCCFFPLVCHQTATRRL